MACCICVRVLSFCSLLVRAVSSPIALCCLYWYSTHFSAFNQFGFFLQKVWGGQQKVWGWGASSMLLHSWSGFLLPSTEPWLCGTLSPSSLPHLQPCITFITCTPASAQHLQMLGWILVSSWNSFTSHFQTLQKPFRFYILSSGCHAWCNVKGIV